MFQQGQFAGGILYIGQYPVHQTVIEAQSHQTRRFFNHPPQFSFPHGFHLHKVIDNKHIQFLIISTLADKIGT